MSLVNLELGEKRVEFNKLSPNKKACIHHRSPVDHQRVPWGLKAEMKMWKCSLYNIVPPQKTCEYVKHAYIFLLINIEVFTNLYYCSSSI